MPKVSSLSPLLLVLVATASVRAAEDSPREIVLRALEAAGVKDPDRSMALRTSYKLSGPHAEKMRIEMVGDAAGKSARLAVTEDGTGRPIMRFVTHGVKSWVQDGGGAAEDLAGHMLPTWLEMQHAERVLWLVPLLQDGRFSLKGLGVSRIAEREVAGIRVSHPGRKDVLLYFDRGTGLLARARYSWGEAKEVEQEFRDYRAVDWDAADRKVLEGVSRTLDAAVLLQFVRAQTPDPAGGVRVAALIRQLGDESFTVRQKASKAILDEGETAVPWLRQAAHSADPEVARRAREAYHRAGAATTGPQIRAAARVLGRKKSAEAAGVLLAYLVHCQDRDERQELLAALAALARRDGRPDAALRKALAGPEPGRGLAAAALGRDGGALARQPGRRLHLPGLKVAHRTILSVEREKLVELELLDFQVFNDHPARLFARPVVPPAE